MSEAAAGGATSAGRLLREAREARRMPIAALASAIKVAPRKLELLEADRFDQLVDPTFARALAQTVCRSLKIDAAPVLALLPRPTASRLGEAGRDLNAPFHEPAGPIGEGDWSVFARPAIWGPLLLLVIAAGVYFMPHNWLGSSQLRRTSEPDTARGPGNGTGPATVSSERPAAAQAPAATAEAAMSVAPAASAPEATAETPAPMTPLPNDDATPAVAGASPPAKLLQVHVTAQSWVEVIDVRGQSLLSRVIQPGENIELDGVAPLKIKIGNAAATEVVFRGQPLALAPYTRDNLARLELK
jgi:cytoskeleton protein RodZ